AWAEQELALDHRRPGGAVHLGGEMEEPAVLPRLLRIEEVLRGDADLADDAPRRDRRSALDLGTGGEHGRAGRPQPAAEVGRRLRHRRDGEESSENPRGRRQPADAVEDWRAACAAARFHAGDSIDGRQYAVGSYAKEVSVRTPRRKSPET